MRVIAVLILGIVMYWGMPYLWTRMMVAEVNRVSADSSSFPEMNAAVATDGPRSRLGAVRVAARAGADLANGLLLPSGAVN